MKLTFLGHAALLIEDGSFKALIDPFLTKNPMYKPNPNDTKDITHIFVTHGHQDHVGDALSIAKENDAIIITNAELASIFWRKDRTLKLHPMHIGGAYNFEFGRVKMTPAVHGSSFQDEDGVHEGGNPGGFLIAVNGITIYHAGDTGLIYDMKLLQEDNVDIAFLPIGGNYTMDIKDAVRAVSFIEPSLTVPIHYNTFPLIQADPDDFVKALPNHNIKILQPSESISL
jgi:L-ascorbate metabolism protein UlaG (beta-lactamase superfamily)